MILYHHPTVSALHCPVGCSADTIKGLTNKVIQEPIRQLLLIRHPLDRLLLIHQQTAKEIEFKQWILAIYTPPQSAETVPTDIVRAEFFKRDMAELGIEATMELEQPKRMEVCMTSRVIIRQRYKDDYLLGEYD